MYRVQANWDAIKTAYISGMSLSALAKQYGVNRSTIANHASIGHWHEARVKAGAVLGASVTGRNGEGMRLLFDGDKPTDRIEDITDQCLRVVKTGLDKIESGMLMVDPKDSGTIRSYCSSLKDLQSVAGAFAGMTRAEIAARIEQIQRQRQIDEEYGTGIVMIPAVEEAAQDV